MKRLLGTIFLVSGMLLASGARAEDKYSLFGIILGDNINKYNPKNENLIAKGAFIVTPLNQIKILFFTMLELIKKLMKLYM